MSRIYFEDHRPDKPVSKNKRFQAILKVVSLFGFMIVGGSVLLIQKISIPVDVNQVKIKSGFGRIEVTMPYKNTLYENFGFVQEPKVMLPLKGINGYKNTAFLLDSGAVVSALPLRAAKETGVDLTQSKRITLQGFTGTPTFAYLDTITVKIGNKDFEFPAVFTESETTTYILGRKGFFDDFKVEFDNEKRAVTISTKE